MKTEDVRRARDQVRRDSVTLASLDRCELLDCRNFSYALFLTPAILGTIYSLFWTLFSILFDSFFSPDS